MVWARIDDGFWRNPKIVALSPMAFRLYVRAIVYCCEQTTDGEVDAIALGMLQARERDVTELRDAGLWAGSPLFIKDFLKYNLSAAQIRSRNDSKAIAGAIGAATRWGKQEPKQTDGSVPVPLTTTNDRKSTGRGVVVQRARARKETP